MDRANCLYNFEMPWVSNIDLKEWRTKYDWDGFVDRMHKFGTLTQMPMNEGRRQRRYVDSIDENFVSMFQFAAAGSDEQSNLNSLKETLKETLEPFMEPLVHPRLINCMKMDMLFEDQKIIDSISHFRTRLVDIYGSNAFECCGEDLVTESYTPQPEASPAIYSSQPAHNSPQPSNSYLDLDDEFAEFRPLFNFRTDSESSTALQKDWERRSAATD